jgi:hypothetical protein
MRQQRLVVVGVVGLLRSLRLRPCRGIDIHKRHGGIGQHDQKEAFSRRSPSA